MRTLLLLFSAIIFLSSCNDPYDGFRESVIEEIGNNRTLYKLQHAEMEVMKWEIMSLETRLELVKLDTGQFKSYLSEEELSGIRKTLLLTLKTIRKGKDDAQENLQKLRDAQLSQNGEKN